jgi:hypothetical protein
LTPRVYFEPAGADCIEVGSLDFWPVEVLAARSDGDHANDLRKSEGGVDPRAARQQRGKFHPVRVVVEIDNRHGYREALQQGKGEMMKIARSEKIDYGSGLIRRPQRCNPVGKCRERGSTRYHSQPRRNVATIDQIGRPGANPRRDFALANETCVKVDDGEAQNQPLVRMRSEGSAQ